MTADLPQLLSSLPPGTVPSGRLVASSEDGGPPLYWLSDEPAEAGLWADLRSRHPGSGLWPLLLGGLSGDQARPWADGEVYPAGMSSPERHDAAVLLAKWWDVHTRVEADDEYDMLSRAERVAVTAPFGQHWPGLAAAGGPAGPPGHFADQYADVLLDRSMRLGLVPATRGADALTAAGWSGPVNYTNDTGEISAVVRSWEERFGAQVVGVGFGTLYLSIAAPPTSPEHALQVAAEHFAFCPDNIWQGAETLTAYAEQIVDMNCWSFWWD